MQYDMVFEGGGAKGMVFVGAMEVFDPRDIPTGGCRHIGRGDHWAALLAAGYHSQEMLETLSEKVDGHSVFSDFMAVPSVMDKDEIHSSATRKLLRTVNLSFIPDRFRGAAG